MTELPPALLCAHRDELGLASSYLTRAGWTLRSAFELPEEPWDLSPQRWVCVGEIDAESTRIASVWALVRGCAIAAWLSPEAAADPEFLADLRRCGATEHWETPTPSADLAHDGPLDEHERGLLAALARGLSVHQAAAELFLSSRTSQRRLATARRKLGVRTNREAVMAWMSLPHR